MTLTDVSSNDNQLVFVSEGESLIVRDENGHDIYSDIPGATDGSYTIEEVTADDAGTYDVIVTNTCGSAESDPATLTVEDCCPGDLDGDGQTGQTDLGILLADWGCTGDDCVAGANAGLR